MSNIVIIPAAGVGKRFNASFPKQFLKINGKEIILHTLIKFQKAKNVDEIIISTRKEFVERLWKLVKKNRLNKVTNIVLGGKERQDSVYAALNSKTFDDKDLICVHDAVRPFITSEDIDNLIEFAKKKGSVIAASKAVDTVKTGKMIVEQTLDRNRIWLVQTPQIFRYKILKKAFEKAYNENFYGTDEASLVERIGKKIYFYQLNCENRKITLKQDFNLAKKTLK